MEPKHKTPISRGTPRQVRSVQTVRGDFEAAAQLEAEGIAALRTNRVAERARNQHRNAVSILSTKPPFSSRWRAASLARATRGVCDGGMERAWREAWDGRTREWREANDSDA